MARNQVAKKEVNVEAGTVTFKFSDGKELPISLDNIPAEMIRRLALHGIGQKVGDAYAGSDVGDAHADASEVADMLQRGVWTERTAGEPRTSVLAEALARVAGQTVEAALEVIKGLDDDQRKALRSHPQIKAAMSAIKAEKDAAAAEKAGSDLSAILAPKA